MNLLLGETFIWGLERDTARRVMLACRNLGIDRQVVRTTDSGFVVPNEVADELETMSVPQWADEEATI